MYLKILVYFVLELTLLACTQSVDNLLQTLMVLCENEYLIPSNLLRFVSYLTFLNFAKKYYNQSLGQSFDKRTAFDSSHVCVVFQDVSRVI